MKIVLITNAFPTENAPTATYTGDIVEVLAQKGHQVRVIVHGNLRKKKIYNYKGAEIIEYPTSFFWDPKLHKSTEMITSLKSSFLAWVELFISFFNLLIYSFRYGRGFDVIQAHWYLPSGLVAVIVNCFFRKPLVVTALGAEFHLPRNFFTKYLLNVVHNSADRVTTNSRYLTERAKGYHLETGRIRIIPTAVNLERFSSQKKVYLKKEKTIILTLCRLIPTKKVEDLIEAVSMLSDPFLKQIEIWIVGDGPERNRLEKMVFEKKLESHVKFWGKAPHSRVPEIIGQADIFINPTVEEGMSTTNIEAMAMGCCAIATDGFGNNEVITDQETGFLYHPGDVQALKKILEVILSQPEKIQNIVKNASEYIRTHHDIRMITDQYLEIYDDLIKNSQN